ncbi:amino acid ABC transporter membrane protein 2 (PAAT family) [Kineothrix alysoides]|uniref:Amino acid ABC transporter membrane protein 2 (PAAT family) n=1 Tax=Kineothrix alysoides TaxID=1469948 RepID=A0A4R1R3L3_9FIRM|nr:amino acid ABC transporter permease [Kineothrix alysoides]TCL60014.1 amino acid ABC transporter membrane protein 2 (PAAT family) [Kineothrix alysoides]
MNWTFLYQTLILVLHGIPMTLFLTEVSLLFSVPLAFGIALVRKNNVAVLDKICAAYVSFIRGTPVILQIYVIYNIVPSILAVLFEMWGIDYPVYEINPVIYAIIIFSLSTSATMSEVIRSALATVDKGQYEAAVTIGLSGRQAYFRIVFPQALVAAVPNLCTLVVNLIKSTSLAFAMTVQDITAIAKIEAASGYNYIEAYLDIFIVYLVLCSAVEQIFKLVECRLKRYKSATI